MSDYGTLPLLASNIKFRSLENPQNSLIYKIMALINCCQNSYNRDCHFTGGKLIWAKAYPLKYNSSARTVWSDMHKLSGGLQKKNSWKKCDEKTMHGFFLQKFDYIFILDNFL